VTIKLLVLYWYYIIYLTYKTTICKKNHMGIEKKTLTRKA